MAATMEAEGRVRLLSPYAKLRLCLEPPQLAAGPHGQTREVPHTRKQVRFHNGRATMPVEWLPLLKSNPFFTGDGQKRCVFLDGDPDAMFSMDHGVGVVTGAMGTISGGRIPAPLPGWDDLPVGQILDAVDAGRVVDANAALVYELTQGRRRAAVVTRLHKLAIEHGVEPERNPGAVATETAAALGAAPDVGQRVSEIPAGAGKVP